MTKDEILERYETYVRANTTPIFLKENVLLAMDEYAQQQIELLEKPKIKGNE